MKSTEKVYYLDGIRGLASLIVVLSHFVVAFYPALYNADINQIHTKSGIETIIAVSPLNILYGGNAAVCIFFILSGYVLTYKFFLLKENDYLYAGAVKRYFRLMLPVVFSVILSYMCMKYSIYYNKQASEITRSDWWLGSFWNFEPNFFLMLKEGLIDVFFKKGKANYNPSLWTMTLEFYGSLVVFSIASIVGVKRRRFLVYLLISILVWNTYYLAFILGLILSDLFTSNEKNFLKINNKILVYICGVLGLFLCSYPMANPEGTIYDILNAEFITSKAEFYHIIGAFLIILTLLNSKYLQNIFSTKILRKLGEISFSIYLIHLPIIGSFSSYIFVRLCEYTSYKVNFLITVSLSMIIIVILSIGMTYYIDKTGIQFSKKIYERIFK